MSERPNMDEQRIDEAIAWHQALANDDADWDGYMAWLEADAANRVAFDQIAVLDRVVDDRATDLRLLAPPEPLHATVRPSRRRILAGAVAAAIAVAIGVPALWPGSADTIYTTQAGQTRRIALAAGTSVDLAPSSRLIAIAGDPTRLKLAKGEAYFAVAHDPNRMLSIAAGDYAVQDIGTKFGINLAPEPGSDTVTITVAEGNVSVAPGDGDATKLSAGQQFVARGGSAPARISRIAAADVGSWREGRLVYDRAPLRVVAADLARYSDKAVSVAPELQDRTFSGVLTIGDGSRPLANLADLMAVEYHVDGDSVRLGSSASR